MFENSPATSTKRVGDKWRTTMDKEPVTAAPVILTENAYTDDPWPKLRQTLSPMVSIAIATNPQSDNLQKSSAPMRWLFLTRAARSTLPGMNATADLSLGASKAMDLTLPF